MYELDDEDWFRDKKEFLYAVIEKISELTDRKTVSGLVHEYFGSKKYYARIVSDKKVDAWKKPQRQSAVPVLEGAAPIDTIDTMVQDAVQQYEQKRFVYSSDVRELFNAILPKKKRKKTMNQKEKEYVARRMGVWFKEGRFEHIQQVAMFQNGILYDHKIARTVIGQVIETMCSQKQYAKLEHVLDLPPHIIDEENRAISGVVEAYKITKTLRLKTSKS